MTIALTDFRQSVWRNVAMAPEVKHRPLLLLIIVMLFHAVESHLLATCVVQ